MLMGLVKSVLGSGDGKSPETAFVVIGIDEEYSVMAAWHISAHSRARGGLLRPGSHGVAGITLEAVGASQRSQGTLILRSQRRVRL